MVDILVVPLFGGLEFHGGEGADVQLVDHQAVPVDDIPGAARSRAAAPAPAAAAAGRPGGQRVRAAAGPRGDVQAAEQTCLGVTEAAGQRSQTHLTGDTLTGTQTRKNVNTCNGEGNGEG